MLAMAASFVEKPGLALCPSVHRMVYSRKIACHNMDPREEVKTAGKT